MGSCVGVVPRSITSTNNMNNPQDVARTFFNRAASILQKNGEVLPIICALTNDKCLMYPAQRFLVDASTKNDLVGMLKEIASKQDVVAIVMVMEVWMRKTTKDEAHKSIAEIGGVSDHPDKQEAVVVTCEWHDGRQYMLTGMIQRESGKIALSEPQPCSVFEGRFSDLFPPTAGHQVH